ncbi:cytochrome c551 [Solibacillus sp. FSL W7-1436]|uniref:cytochrome c551 n=1 Tax=Solibacillus sp. FSL W7-1436 TaxID=2921705 RepID=UPI0030F98BB5
MKKSLLTLVFGSVIFLAACGGDDSASNGETAEIDGKSVVQQSCATCHGGQLQGGNAPALNQLGAKYSEEEILDIILNGKDRMPPGIVKGEKAEAAAEYLSTLK